MSRVGGGRKLLEGLAVITAKTDPCPGFRTIQTDRGAVSEWPAFQQQALQFLNDHEAEAAELGWTAQALLGVHHVVGLNRVDYTGALLLGYLPAKAITAETITYSNGLRFQRASVPEDAVAIWDFAATQTKDDDNVEA
jgi:hypothetical protein